MTHPQFINGFKKADYTLTTKDNKSIEVWEFNHNFDESILSEWASEFRKNYIDDSIIDDLLFGTECKNRKEYLLNYVFPSKNEAFGPVTRSGDFAEILLLDFLKYLNNYWTPRTRYDDKVNRNSSTQGSDVIGIKIINEDSLSPDDELIVIEVKAQFSESKPKPRLQDAVDDSNKDPSRLGESLNAIKRRFLKEHNIVAKNKIERFQNYNDKPYIRHFGAAALFTENMFDKADIQETDCSNHKNKNDLILLVFSGKDMMKLVHEIYERATDEA